MLARTLSLTLIGALVVCGARAAEPPLVIKAGRVITVNGETFAPGVVLVRDGKIVAVGREVAAPSDARTYDFPQGVLTPGLIDACCVLDFQQPEAGAASIYGQQDESLWQRLAHAPAHDPNEEDDVCRDGDPAPPAPLAAATGINLTWAEQTSEVTPHRLVYDAINLFSRDFERLRNGGVTTVFVSPDAASVIGSRGTIVKTGGPLAQRVVRRADAVKATIGIDPSVRGRRNYLPPTHGPTPSVYTRRPTTRMGVEWVFRKAFFDAERARAGEQPTGADVPPAGAWPVLQQILDGDVPLRIQARMQHDIYTALRLADEFKLHFTLEEATEAYRCLPQLKAAGVPVIFGPLYETPSGFRAQTDEVERARLNSPQQLADAGIAFALTAQELRDEEGLVRQGMVASRFGLSADDALRAITATPARLLGLEGQAGVVAPGASADLVVWSAAPFDPVSQPLLVLINGQVTGPRGAVQGAR
jgi:imidazolonepropionase-like amidohydrolase